MLPPELQTKHENGKGGKKAKNSPSTRRKIAGGVEGEGKTLRNMFHVRRGKQKGEWPLNESGTNS